MLKFEYLVLKLSIIQLYPLKISGKYFEIILFAVEECRFFTAYYADPDETLQYVIWIFWISTDLSGSLQKFK